jgi:glycosyltransferase involved in cell wall biosynthesis
MSTTDPRRAPRGPLAASLAYLKRALPESLRAHPLTRAIAARFLAFQARWLCRQPTRRLVLLARAAQLCPDAGGRHSLTRAVREELERLDPAAIDWNALEFANTDRRDVPKAILLKPPVSDREKGVLHIPFEEQWLRLFRSGQAGAIARRYDLLLGPSWSPPPESGLLLALRLWPGRLYTLLSNFDDEERMRSLSDRLVPVPLLASSWVNPAVFEPCLGMSRDYDIVMLANFAAFKRHWLFFHVLRRLPRSYRVLLLGVPLGQRKEDALRAEARGFGVEDRFDLVVRPTRAQIAEGLCRSRISLVFSRGEGSCIAVAESLLADTPVGLFHDARIGSRVFLNARTGRLLRRHRLAQQVQQFVEESSWYRPRSWALEHISCLRSHEVLGEVFRNEARRQGLPWTRDLEPMQNDTYPCYLSADTAAEMRPWVEDFERQYGLRLGTGWREECPAPALLAEAR